MGFISLRYRTPSRFSPSVSIRRLASILAVRAIERDGTGVLATIEIAATNQNGIVALEGEAVVAL